MYDQKDENEPNSAAIRTGGGGTHVRRSRLDDDDNNSAIRTGGGGSQVVQASCEVEERGTKAKSRTVTGQA
jgi:hypothetical protein